MAEKNAQLAKEAVEAERQAVYQLGVEKTQIRLTGEFSIVCRDYCDITWGKALDAAGIFVDSDLRQLGSIYYDLDIRKLLDSEPSSLKQLPKVSE